MTAEEVFVVGRDGKYSSLSPLYAKGEGYFSAEEQGHTKGSVLCSLYKTNLLRRKKRERMYQYRK